MGYRFSTIRRRRGRNEVKILGGRCGHPWRHFDRDYSFCTEYFARRQKPRIGNLPVDAPFVEVEPVKSEWEDENSAFSQAPYRRKSVRSFGGGRSDGKPVGQWRAWRRS